jgi:hypothetical protein
MTTTLRAIASRSILTLDPSKHKSVACLYRRVTTCSNDVRRTAAMATSVVG